MSTSESANVGETRGGEVKASETLITINLQSGRWIYDAQRRLAPSGGFASVFEGWSAGGGSPVAVKRFHFHRAGLAAREVEIAQELRTRSLKNVVPILDCGIDAELGENFVVMARAQKNLEDHLRNSGETLSRQETIEVVLAILNGLDEIPDLVHRDLKPKNVLCFEGTWKVADLGIARFIQETTSDQTLAQFHSNEYAAPEQWRGSGTSRATDVYAVGCIAFKLIAGRAPFPGPDVEDFRKQHLESVAPKPEQCDPTLWLPIQLALRKFPEGRPSVRRMKALFEGAKRESTVSNNTSNALNTLRTVGAHLEAREAARRAEENEKAEQRARRLEMGTGGIERLEGQVARLFEAIAESIPIAVDGKLTTYPQWADVSKGRKLTFGMAELIFVVYQIESVLNNSNIWPSADTTARAVLTLAQDRGDTSKTWGASLWFSNLEGAQEFRWYEVSYSGHQTNMPIAVDPDAAKLSHARSMSARFPMLFGPRAIDDEDESNFLERWLVLAALAATGRLPGPPSQRRPMGDWWPELPA